jgi:hypothetical protein
VFKILFCFSFTLPSLLREEHFIIRSYKIGGICAALLGFMLDLSVRRGNPEETQPAQDLSGVNKISF